MGRQLAERGPDDEQHYSDDLLSLSFRRLAIVDIAGGRQPIWNEDRSLLVVMNGEIYNHRELRASLRDNHAFRTESDAEVVMHLYEERGADALRSLNGQFTIAIWQPRPRRLFLARDRLGIKPLFYARTTSKLLFASELKALLAHPDCPNEVDREQVALRHAQTWRRPPSYVKGVELLPGGHHLVADADGAVDVRPYWCIDDHFWRDGDRADPASHYVARYGELIEDSVRIRVAGNAALGALLSGGVDSSLVVSLAARAAKQIDCFHVDHEAVEASGDTAAATKLCGALALRLTAHRLDGESFTPDAFEQHVWTYEWPRFYPETLVKLELYRLARAQHPDLKVMLLGQGADELAGGYSGDMVPPCDSWQQYLTRLWSHQGSHQGERTTAPPRDFYQHQMKRYVGLMQSYNLWHEDRCAAHFGMEARVPFLDHRLVELLASVPPQHHAELFYDKAIVRRAARPAIGEACARPKVAMWHRSRIDAVEAMLDAVADRVVPPSVAPEQSGRARLRSMAVRAFEQMCESRFRRPSGLREPPRDRDRSSAVSRRS